jgi:hypothetical protein
MTTRIKELKERLGGVPGPRLRIRQSTPTRVIICTNDKGYYQSSPFSSEQIEAMQRLGIMNPDQTYWQVQSFSIPNELVDDALRLPNAT